MNSTYECLARYNTAGYRLLDGSRYILHCLTMFTNQSIYEKSRIDVPLLLLYVRYVKTIV